MSPKCTSWRGHRFEPRYSSRPTSLTAAQLDQMFFMGRDDRARLTQMIHTYECDVCIRCGRVVQKAQP